MKKIAFLFPGQGAQLPGMGIRHLSGTPLLTELFGRANEVLGYDLARLCCEGSEEVLADTEVTQPALFVTGYGIYQYYRQQLPVPHFMAGHSLGEYTALACAGALAFEEGLRIVQKRARLMKSAALGAPGAMMAVNGIGEEQLAGICASFSRPEAPVGISACNSQRQFVISGPTQQVFGAGSQAEQYGANVVQLKVSAPFHCDLMAGAAAQLTPSLQPSAFRSPSCKVLSNVTGLPYADQQEMAAGLQTQMTMPVKWKQSMDHLIEKGVRLFIEIGPGKTLRNLLKDRPGIHRFSLGDETDRDTLPTALTEQMPGLSTIVSRSRGMAMSIRNRNDDEHQYRQGVVRPFQAIGDIQTRLEKNRSFPCEQDIAETLQHFCTILNTKMISHEQKLEWLHRLCWESGSGDLYSANLHFFN